MERIFATPEPIALNVEVGRGSIRVEAAERDSTVVRVVGPRADQVQVTHQGDRVDVVAPKNWFGFGPQTEQAVEVVVTVPADSVVSLRSHRADISTDGPLRGVAVGTGSGAVRIGGPTGWAKIGTGTGNITMTEGSGELRLKSATGAIQLERVESSANISTGSGNVTLGRTSGPVEITTGSGDLEVAESGADLSMATGSGDVRVRRAVRGRLTLRNASGNMQIGVASGTPVWTDIATSSGRIASDLPSTGEPAAGQEFIELRARSVSGTISLVQV